MQKAIIYTAILLLFASLTLAGPVQEKDITFNINVQANGTLSFVQTNIYNQTANYREAKNNCANTFSNVIYEMDAQERQHKRCTINGTYQEVYCFKTVTNNSACQGLETKLDDNLQLKYHTYYNAIMWDLNQSTFYDHKVAASCIIKDNVCTVTIKKGMINPFIVVFENETDVFVATNVILDQVDLFNTNAFDCEGNDCDVHLEFNVTPSKFELSKPHTLIFDIKEKSWYQKCIAWLLGLFE